jgi:hypothetical protein
MIGLVREGLLRYDRRSTLCWGGITMRLIVVFVLLAALSGCGHGVPIIPFI